MAKTLFHSSEKSNFILNMTEEKYSKLASRGLFIAMLMTPLFTLIPEISYTVSASGEAAYEFSSGGLVCGGVIAMIIAIIGMMKKYISKWNIFPVCAMGAMVLWGAVSLANGVNLGISLYGYSTRGEGLLAIIFYFCFFASAAALKRETALRTVLDGIIGVGVLNSIISLVQIFTGKLSHYKSIGDDKNIYAASGLSMSPLFLAMVLTLALTAALIGFVTSESKKRRIVLILCAALFSFVMMFTYSLIGFCGFAFALIITIAAVCVLKAPKKRLGGLLVSIVSAAAAVVIVFCGLIGTENSYSLHDGRILWWADGYYRASACGIFDPAKVDIDDTLDVYSYLNRRSIDVIKNNPMVGTGPDQLAFAFIAPVDETTEQLSISDFMIHDVNKGTFDKVYNEYIYTAATRGIPSLIALVLVLIPVMVLGVRSFKKKRSAETFGIFAVALGGVLIFFVGCSSIPFAPVFWTAAGAACAELTTEKANKAKEKLARKKK